MASTVSEIKVDLEHLPSKGKAYPKGTKISYVTYTWGQIQEMSTSRLDYVGYLKKCMLGVRGNMNPLDITLADAMYLIMLRKISTLGGSEFTVPWTCYNQKCKSENTKNFTQNDIHFNDMQAEECPLGFELESGKALEFAPLTVGNFIKLMDGTISKEYAHIKDLYKQKVAVLAATITNMKFDDAYALLQSTEITQSDGEVIEEIDRLLSHDVQKLDDTCPSCGATISISLEGKESLFRTRDSGKSDVRDRIRFGKRVESASVTPKRARIQRSNLAEQAFDGVS